MSAYDISMHLQSATLELDKYMDGLGDTAPLDPRQDHHAAQGNQPAGSGHGHGLKRHAHKLDAGSKTNPDGYSRKKKKQMYRNMKRQIQRQEHLADHGRKATPRILREHVQLVDAFNPGLDTTKLPCAEGAYSSKPLKMSRVDREREYTAEELQAEHGFNLLKANEQYVEALLDLH